MRAVGVQQGAGQQGAGQRKVACAGGVERSGARAAARRRVKWGGARRAHGAGGPLRARAPARRGGVRGGRRGGRRGAAAGGAAGERASSEALHVWHKSLLHAGAPCSLALPTPLSPEAHIKENYTVAGPWVLRRLSAAACMSQASIAACARRGRQHSYSSSHQQVKRAKLE